ncbi:hypothetical protein [Aliihoeflea sp. 40Bstr573]|uniref:hypothetical protein n=1 Tax=Aliihoeflea sp. 40Bstr573 TaxID=2696467 RepID=UPI002094A72D|nr:hypothetical protein [Aliihoeflea sp. 40Bstr573]MCO6389373.1 hypothetical protein [Aliihoeflea sp. 40Bstr573]
MKLKFIDDDNIMASDLEPGSVFNGGEQMVLLRLPTVQELRDLWQEFDREIRLEFRDLLQSTFGELETSKNLPISPVS